MFGLGVDALVGVFRDLIQLFPNAEQRERAGRALQDFELAMAQGQMEINKAEAANASIFVSGWRPAVGWICASGFLYTVIQPVLHLPAADMNVLITVLGGLLGLGTMRTVEKVTGVAK